MIDQITVFLENRKGRLASLCRCLADAGINMEALTIADTSDYGVARILCSDPARARETLEKWGYRAITTKVAAFAVPNRPGGLAELLEAIDGLDMNIEYGYCFSLKGDQAVDVLKITEADEADEAIAAIEAAGFKSLSIEDIVH
jgi:hypothetical protein